MIQNLKIDIQTEVYHIAGAFPTNHFPHGYTECNSRVQESFPRQNIFFFVAVNIP